MKIQPIVEGHGDVEAVPVLLRRLADDAQAWEVRVGRSIRRNRSQLVEEAELQKAVRLALLQPDCSAILILFDADDDCPAELAPRIRGWAEAVAGKVPCAVVLAKREYEAWFLASIETLRGVRGIRSDAAVHPEPESPRDAKGQLERRMVCGSSYIERTDQPALSARFAFPEAHRRCRSFRKLTSAFGTLVRAMGVDLSPWPPAAWGGS
ncbi:MAG: DUF4276 family protein [Spirochaetaceae bacterium]|nr:DUF4276 family protein [Spirochaetaceae bacterium]